MKLFNSEAATVEKTKHLSPLGEKQSLHYYAVSRAPIGKWSPHQKNLVAPPPPPPLPKKENKFKKNPRISERTIHVAPHDCLVSPTMRSQHFRLLACRLKDCANGQEKESEESLKSLTS